MKNTATLFFCLLFLTIIGTSNAQSGQMNFNKNSDTTIFKIYAVDGWQLLNAFIAPAFNDSVILEIILAHKNDIQFQNYKLVGRIADPKNWPKQKQELSFSLLKTDYLFLITSVGYCYLRCKSVHSFQENMVVIPIKVGYTR